MRTNTDKIKQRYDRASFVYDVIESPMEIIALKKGIKVWEMAKPLSQNSSKSIKII